MFESFVLDNFHVDLSFNFTTNMQTAFQIFILVHDGTVIDIYNHLKLNCFYLQVLSFE